MLKNFIITAIRNFRRHIGYMLINIFGLALGIAVFCLIMSYVQYEFSADRFHKNYANIYRVDLDSRFGVTPITLKQTISDRFPEIPITRYFPRNSKVIYEEKKLDSSILFVDPEFFDIFSYEAIQGNLQEVIKEPASAIVTEKWAKKMFGDIDPIGKSINYNREVDLEIKAVIKDPTGRSQLLVREVIAPLHSLKNILDFENSWFSNYVTFLLLPPHHEAAETRKQIDDFFIELHNEIDPNFPTFYLRPFSELYFDSSKFDYCAHGNKTTVMTFLAAALFIILIACFNYINLATARAALRARETGIRKVVGSSRQMLIWQMISESVLLCLLALLLVIIIIWLAYPAFSDFFRINAGFFNWQRLLFLLGITVFVGIAAGIYPAFYQTSFEPVYGLKRTFSSGSKGILFRRILIILQFTISIAMIVCTLTVFGQLKYFLDHDLGFDKEQVITFRQTVEIMDNRDAFRQELLKSPRIKGASCTYLAMGRIILSGWYIEEGDSEENKKKYRVINTDPYFLDVYGVKLLAGRNFNPDLESDHDNILVNEAFVKEHITEDPLQYTLWENTQVIGIVKDFSYRPLQYEIEPLILFWNPEETFAMALRILPENISETADYVENIFHQYSPDVEFEYEFQDEVFAAFYAQEKRFGQIFSFFAALAVVIACLGMFGLALFLVTNRTREIGIRKVLGADSASIILLLNKEFTRLVLIAGILAAPLAWLVMHNWLDNFAFHTQMKVLYFIMAALAALLISWITVSWQTLKAAATNPVEAIKYE
ncbi:MAG: ABC transporter permease [Candidatus Cloacimonetes bacterium]|nr:ABC transporter permease [Candidatus Cloacimonadota bacterium]